MHCPRINTCIRKPDHAELGHSEMNFGAENFGSCCTCPRRLRIHRDLVKKSQTPHIIFAQKPKKLYTFPAKTRARRRPQLHMHIAGVEAIKQSIRSKNGPGFSQERVAALQTCCLSVIILGALMPVTLSTEAWGIPRHKCLLALIRLVHICISPYHTCYINWIIIIFLGHPTKCFVHITNTPNVSNEG